MPKIVDASEQRVQIRGAARRVLSRGGAAGLGLGRVAREAGVSRSTLYHYYEDKAALVRDLARELLEEEEALFGDLLRGPGTVPQRIQTLADRIVDRFSEWSQVGGALLQIWIEERARVRRLLRNLRRDLADVLREGQRAGEIDPALPAGATATLLIGTIDGLLIQVYLDPKAFAGDGELRLALARAFEKVLRPPVRHEEEK